VSSQCHIWKNTKETYHEKHMEEKLNILSTSILGQIRCQALY